MAMTLPPKSSSLTGVFGTRSLKSTPKTYHDNKNRQETFLINLRMPLKLKNSGCIQFVSVLCFLVVKEEGLKRFSHKLHCTIAHTVYQTVHHTV